MIKRLLNATALALIFGIAGIANAAGLQARLDAPGWDGKTIPQGQQCHRFGGHGATPRIAVSDIHPGTRALVLAFSDHDYPPMNHGGHGVIGYLLPSASHGTIVVPSVPGQTFDLPAGFFMVHAQANPSFDTAGAYLPPCSGGRNHLYYVTVQAVTLDAAGRPKTILGET